MRAACFTRCVLVLAASASLGAGAKADTGLGYRGDGTCVVEGGSPPLEFDVDAGTMIGGTTGLRRREYAVPETWHLMGIAGDRVYIRGHSMLYAIGKR